MQHVRRVGRVGIGFLVLVFGSALWSAYGSDMSLYGVYKRQVYLQKDAGAPLLLCCGNVFNAIVEPTDSNSVTTAVLATPDGKQTLLSLGAQQEFLPRSWVLSACSTYQNRESLDANWTSGNYTLAIYGANDGLVTATLNLSGDAYPTNPPHILNFTETQAVDASKDFVLHWEGFDDATTNDFCFVSVKKADETLVSSMPFLEEANKLDGTATSLVIPAGTLAPNEHYEVYVRFDKVLARNSSGSPTVTSHASYARGTRVSLVTLP
jgi:hypothetical protein